MPERGPEPRSDPVWVFVRGGPPAGQESAGRRMGQRYSSHSFRSEQTFSSMASAAAKAELLSLRAAWGQTEMHRIQEMQSFGSVLWGSVMSMAWTGQFLAQVPQAVQPESASGIMEEPPSL